MPKIGCTPRRGPRVARGRCHMRAALLFAGSLFLAVPVSTFAGPDEPVAPLLYDGDLLSTSDTRGPGLQRLSLRCGLATGESQRWGTLQATTLRAEYGLREDLSAGLAATFYSETHARLDGEPAWTKQGPGDTRLFLRWQYTGLESSSLSLGLRPALRIPTGFDRDGDSLAPFTTRTLDFELLGLATLETDRVDFYVNPGISLPGADRNSEVLAALGVLAHDGLPFGLQLAGEYSTRYDLPARTFRHEVFAALGVPLPLGLLADVGVRKPLLDTEATQPEIAVRLGLGLRHRSPDFTARADLPARRVTLAPCASAIEDPRGVARAIDRELRTRLIAQRDLEVTASPSPDDPGVRLEILSLREGTTRSLSVPKLFASPRATLELDARLTLTDAGGRVIYGERLLHVSVGRGMGMILVPNEGDEDTWVPTGEVRERLRIAAARALAEQAHAAIVQMIVEIPGR